MAFRRKKIFNVLSYIVILIYFQTSTAINIDCGGKAFHCLNLTHFMICVDFGAGISKTVDDFVIQCPSTTVCRRDNRFECEYQLPTTSESTIGLGDETNIVEINEQLTTTATFRETNEMRLLLSKYLNTVSITTQSDIVTDKPTENPGTTVEITDNLSNNMTSTRETYLSYSTTKPEPYIENKLVKPPLVIRTQNSSNVVNLLKASKNNQSFQENTTILFTKKPKEITPEVFVGKAPNLINATSTLDILEISHGADKLNETNNYVKLLDTVLYDDRTVLDSSAFTNFSSQNASNSSNIDIVSTKLFKSFNQLNLSITTDVLNGENIFENSTSKSTKTPSNNVNKTENFLTPQITSIKTTSREYVYPRIKRILDFEPIAARIEKTTMTDELVSEMETQNIITERASVSINTTDSHTIPSYSENILNMKLSGANPSSNGSTMLSSYSWIFSSTSNPLKLHIQSAGDDTRTVTATENINKPEVTTLSPYVFIRAHVVKDEITETSVTKSTTLMADIMRFTHDQITVEKKSNFANIPKNNTKVKVLQQTTRWSNNVMNLTDNNYKATNRINESEVTPTSPYLIIKANQVKELTKKSTEGINELEVTNINPYLITRENLLKEEVTEKSETQSTTVIEDHRFRQDNTTVDKNSVIETFAKIPKNNVKVELLQPITTSSNNPINWKDNNLHIFKNVVNMSILDQDKEGLVSDKNMNESSHFSSTNILATTDLSKFEPNLVTGYLGTDIVIPFHIIKENISVANGVNENMNSTKNQNSAQQINESPYTTESENISIVPTIHQNSAFIGAMKSLVMENVISNNILRVQDRIPTEMSATEMNFFLEKNSSTILSPEPTISTIHSNINYTSNRDNEKFKSFETGVILNEEYKTADVTKMKDIDILTTPALTSMYAGGSVENLLNTNVHENITSTNESRKNDVLLSYGIPTLQTNIKSLDVLTNIATARDFPDIPKLKQNDINNTHSEITSIDTIFFNRKLHDNVTMNVYNDQNTIKESGKISIVDSNPYLLKNPLNVLSYNKSFSNISDKILWNNLTSGNISFEGNNDLYTKDKILWKNFTSGNISSEGNNYLYTIDYQQESSTHRNESETITDNKNLETFETSTNEINDVYSSYLKYYLPLTTANDKIKEVYTTDVPINVDNIRILKETNILKRSSTNTKADDVFKKNNVIEKPLIFSSTVQPLAGRVNIKNVISDVLQSTSILKVTQIDDVLQNVVSDEPIKKITDMYTNFNYNNYETYMTSTVADNTENLVQVLSSERYAKPTKISDVGSTYEPKISITKNVDENSNISEMPYLSSVILKNNVFNENVKYKKSEVNNTQVDLLLKEFNQNVSNAPTKNNSTNSDVITDKNRLLNTNVGATTSTMIADKTLSIQIPNLNKQISNIPISMPVNASHNIVMHKLENNSIEEGSVGKNTLLNYKTLHNDNIIERVSNQITILENYNTSSFSVGLKRENFEKISIASGTTINASVIQQVGFESTTPKIKENIQVVSIYPDVMTTYPQTITGGTGNINAENRNYLIGTLLNFNSTLKWKTEPKIHIISKSNDSHNESATLFAKHQETKLHMDDVKINYTFYDLSNNETRQPTIRESVKKAPSHVQGPVVLQNFSIKSPNTVTNFEQKNIQVRNTHAVPVGNITNNDGNIYVVNSEVVLPNGNSKEQLREQVTNIKSPRDKKEAKDYVNNIQFTCMNKFRARYADKSDCRKFYICIGKYQPLLGECPVNTVFSDIKKQCTKNLSHCIINNQFRCIQEGRFYDVLNNDIYYICVKNKNAYIRFKFQCQRGYYLNKTTIRCVPDRQIESQMFSISSDNESNKASDQSTVERKSKETKQAELIENNICKYEGKFRDPDDCRRYYICSKNSKSVFRRRTKKCDSDEVFHRERKKCVKDDSYECT